MLTEELKAQARRVPEELLTQGDLSVADQVLDPDCNHHALASLTPGAEGIKQWAAALRRAFPDLRAIVEDEIAEGDTVVQRITCSGTHRGEYLGVPPTGKRATWQLVAIHRLGQGGKFAEHWSSADLFGLLHQLGGASASGDTNVAAKRKA